MSHMNTMDQERDTNDQQSSSPETCIDINPIVIVPNNNSCSTNKDEKSAPPPPPPSKTFILSSFHAGYFRITLSLSSQALLWKTLSSPTSSSSSNFPLRDLSHILPSTAFVLLWSIALTALVAVSFLFVLRCLLRFPSVKFEFMHHVGVNYLFAPWISWLLLLQSSPISFLSRSSTVYVVLWWVFTVPIVALELKIYGQWLTKGKRFLSMVANPTSQMSVIANMVCASAAAETGWMETALCVFSFGMAHYLVLFVTLYQRFSDRIPSAMRPVFFLFFATPCFASLAWCSISGSFDVGSKMLFFLSLFLFASLVLRPALFVKSMKKFSVAWWAYSFPVTALALASFKYAQVVKNRFANGMMLVLTVISVGVALILMAYTVLRTSAILPYHDPFMVPSNTLPCRNGDEESSTTTGTGSSSSSTTGGSCNTIRSDQR